MDNISSKPSDQKGVATSGRNSEAPTETASSSPRSGEGDVDGYANLHHGSRCSKVDCSFVHQKSGSKFWGELDAEGRRHGRGIYERRTGKGPDDHCEVTYRHGKLQQVIRWKHSGLRLETLGLCATGHGRLFFKEADQPFYEGSLRDGIPHGQGSLRGIDGFYYTGGMREGAYHGHGSLWNTSTQLRLTGRFDRGMFVSKIGLTAPSLEQFEQALSRGKTAKAQNILKVWRSSPDDVLERAEEALSRVVVQSQCPALLDACLALGANLQAIDECGATLLHKACGWSEHRMDSIVNRATVLAYLTHRRLSDLIVSDSPYRPLQEDIIYNNLPIPTPNMPMVHILLQRGLRLSSALDREVYATLPNGTAAARLPGLTCWHLAALCGHEELMALCLRTEPDHIDLTLSAMHLAHVLPNQTYYQLKEHVLMFAHRRSLPQLIAAIERGS